MPDESSPSRPEENALSSHKPYVRLNYDSVSNRDAGLPRKPEGGMDRPYQGRLRKTR